MPWRIQVLQMQLKEPLLNQNGLLLPKDSHSAFQSTGTDASHLLDIEHALLFLAPNRDLGVLRSSKNWNATFECYKAPKLAALSSRADSWGPVQHKWGSTWHILSVQSARAAQTPLCQIFTCWINALHSTHCTVLQKKRGDGKDKRENRQGTRFWMMDWIEHNSSVLIFKPGRLRNSSRHVLWNSIQMFFSIFFPPVAGIMKKLHRTAISRPLLINHLSNPCSSCPNFIFRNSPAKPGHRSEAKLEGIGGALPWGDLIEKERFVPCAEPLPKYRQDEVLVHIIYACWTGQADGDGHGFAVLGVNWGQRTTRHKLRIYNVMLR